MLGGSVGFNFDKLSDEEIEKKFKSLQSDLSLASVINLIGEKIVKSAEEIAAEEKNLQAAEAIYESSGELEVEASDDKKYKTGYGHKADRAYWFFVNKVPEIHGDIGKFHISLDRDPENIKKAFLLIAPILMKHGVQTFKYATSKDASGNPLGKECVVYAYSQEDLKKFYDEVVPEISYALEKNKIVVGKEPEGDIRMCGSAYCYSRAERSKFNQYISADSLRISGFSKNESANLRDNFLLDGRSLSVDMATSQDLPPGFSVIADISAKEDITQKVKDELLKKQIDGCFIKFAAGGGGYGYLHDGSAIKFMGAFYPSFRFHLEKAYKANGLFKNDALESLVGNASKIISDLSRKLGIEFSEPDDAYRRMSCVINIGLVQSTIYHKFIVPFCNEIDYPNLNSLTSEQISARFTNFIESYKNDLTKELVVAAFRDKASMQGTVFDPDTQKYKQVPESPVFIFEGKEICGARLTQEHFVRLVENEMGLAPRIVSASVIEGFASSSVSMVMSAAAPEVASAAASTRAPISSTRASTAASTRARGFPPSEDTLDSKQQKLRNILYGHSSSTESHKGLIATVQLAQKLSPSDLKRQVAEGNLHFDWWAFPINAKSTRGDVYNLWC